MEVVSCCICGTTRFEERYWPINSGVLVRCRQCGLYYANPRKEEAIQEVITGQTAPELLAGKMINQQGRILEFKDQLGVIARYKKPPGKLLDVGCYEGFFLNEARHAAWSCTGVEPSRGGARFARETLGLDVREGILETSHFGAGAFDVVSMLAVLEHVPKPVETLTAVKRVLKRDGLLVISVPVIPSYLKLVRSRWRMFIGDHYFFFSDRAMQALLGKLGFRLLDKRYCVKYVDLETIVKRLNDPWQPYRLGPLGKLLKVINKTRLRKLRLKVNLFDCRMYVATPCDGD
jgi:SAM-dependent methyltransferase